jgi:glycosyltransferase involved in cell wall biosynthesis
VSRAAPERVKIAHFVISADMYGGQTVALALIEGALQAGHEVLVLAPAPGPFVDRAVALGASTLVVSQGSALDLRRAAHLASVLRREGVDILHTHALFAGNVSSRIAGRLAGAPVVAHAHVEDLWRSGWLAPKLQRRLDALTARLCFRIIAVSAALARELRLRGYPKGRVVVVPNGIAAPALGAGSAADRARAELGLPPDAVVAICVGRLCDTKGQRQLIESLAHLPSEVRVLLVGEDLEQGGMYLTQLVELARRLGVRERVVFAGWRGDVASLLEASDVFVLASALEGMPLSVIEAMAAGLPVIATAVGGITEVVDAETGVIVPSRDPATLARAIAALIADPAHARALGAAGRARYAASFTAAGMVEHVLAIYDEAAADA